MNLRQNPFSSLLGFGIIIIFFLFLIKAFDISYPISITTKTASGELSVVGEGKVDVIPDTASVQAGIVVSDAKNVQEAQTKINDINNNIVAALQKIGIKKEDIKTSNYSISPNYNYQDGENAITGYNGNTTLSIKVKNTENLPSVITEVTKSGANQIYDTQYTIDNPDKYREQARNMAIKNAKDQAQKLADQLGIKLGKVVNIVESQNANQPPYQAFSLEAKGAGGAPDLQPGTQKVTSTVTLFFERK